MDASHQPSRPSVVFFGSGPVAAKSLELLGEWCDIEAVITKPQPAHHKTAFPVLELASTKDWKTLTASNRRELDQLVLGTKFKSRLAVLIDYGIIVSQQVIDSFELGIVNSHFSLLPEWRGADPITFSILSGQKETGVSLMLLVQAMDEGPLLAQATYGLDASATTPNLTQDLVELSDASLRQILPAYFAGKVSPQPQRQVALPGHDVPTYSRKLSKADGVLDFNKTAVELEREVRAFADWPKSRMVIGRKDVVVTASHVANMEVPADSLPGDISADRGKGRILVATKAGYLSIDKLKPAGKNEMDARAFLAGNQI